MSSSRVTVVIAAQPPRRLDKALARDVPESAHLSRSRLVRLIAEGRVRRDGAPVTDATASVAEGDVFEVEVPDAVETDIAPEAIALDIVWEDADLVVINKPAGLVVHPAPGTPSGTLVNALLHRYGADLSGVGGRRRPGIVHRIDKDTSGLLVVARSDRAHHGLARQFEKHRARREYLALCHGVPDPGDPRLRGLRGVSVEPGAVVKVTTGLARHPTDRQRQAVTFDRGRHAISRFRTLRRFNDAAALLSCRLETGRTHQIRVHAAHMGHGLIGDPVYGGRRRAIRGLAESARAAVAAFPRQALHAASLGFAHPVSGEALDFTAPLPDDMEALVAALDGSPLTRA